MIKLSGKNMTRVILSLFILFSTLSLHVIAKEAPLSPASVYQLTSSINAEVKSVLNEQTSDGTRIAAVVRLYNGGAHLTRVPEYEVRVKTQDGDEYTLRASATNAKSIQAKNKVELSYMIDLDRQDAFSLADISWFDVDEYVYPKEETRILSIPISSSEWKGDNTVISDPASIKEWGVPFVLTDLSASLEYTPVNLIEQNTPKGSETILVIRVENKGANKKGIPDFRINGETDQEVYNAKRVEQETITLAPGEQQYIHYAIPVETAAELKSLYVLIPENFAADNQTNINYTIGRLNIKLPDTDVSHFFDGLEAYAFNKPVQLDPLNKLIQPEVEISMSSLRLHESQGGGYKAAVAKFKLLNRGDHPIPVPRFQAQLRNADGYSYMGSRQTTDVPTLIPNIGYVIYYSFILPSTETGDKLAMQILDDQTLPPYSIPIATFQTQAQTETADTTLSFYPFNVKLNNWSIETGPASSQGSQPSYKVKLDLDVSLQEEAVVDQGFPKMKVELLDAQGKKIGSKTFAFTGDNRLDSGVQTLNFSQERPGNPSSIRIYETIVTPFGEAERLVKTLQQ